jgi:hypothetical protein
VYDKNFTYTDGKVSKCDDIDESWELSCGSGIHVSTPFYWQEGDTLIAVDVKVSDVITCQEGKLRCRAVKVIGEVNA